MSDALRRWRKSRLPFAVLVQRMCLAKTRESAKELEKLRLALIRDAGFLRSEGDRYNPGMTSARNPFAGVHFAAIVGIKDGLDGTN